MMVRAELRKGWCPGALRPMESGDGLLLRIRPRLGTLRLAELSTIARTAAAFGSGEIDLTNRGNLQLRGLTASSHTHALEVLDEAGLLDADAGAEAVRNVVVDPLSGLDPSRIDIRHLAQQLEGVLTDDRVFWQLPGKFGFSFSGTADPRVGGRSTDIMVAAVASETCAVVLDGDAEVALVPSRGIAEALKRLAEIFIDRREDDPAIRRMRDVVMRKGSRMLFAAAGLEASASTRSELTETPGPPVGPLSHRSEIFAAGVGLPFGRIEARQLEALRTCASNIGIDAMRMSPQRVLVFPADSQAQASQLLAVAEHQDLIVARDDPRLAFDVCPGSAGCANATTDTRRDAARIAHAILGHSEPASVHVSGCEKGCARRGPAALTLVARDGLYDVIRNDGPSGSATLSGVNPSEIESAVARFIVEHR